MKTSRTAATARSAAALLFLCAAALFSSCDDDPKSPGTSSGMSCEENCDLQVAAGCTSTPANYATSCKALCASQRESTPADCRDELEAQYACAVTKSTYRCENGVIMATPVGACAAEGAACATCRGKLCLPGT